jgi:uncharacterized protein (TIGR02117 family)
LSIVLRSLLAVGGAVGLYLLAALVLGLVPMHAQFRQSAAGVTIFVRSNGVHVDLALPVRSDDVDWRLEFPSRHFTGPIEDHGYIGFGWGDRDFYLQTRTWADVRVGAAASAFLGLKSTVLHVQYMDPRWFAGERMAVVITQEQYARLAAYIYRSLRRDETGSVIAIANARYDGLDAFFEARGSYSAVLTCNEWVRRGLSAAGVRTAWWAPFDVALFYQLRAIP